MANLHNKKAFTSKLFITCLFCSTAVMADDLQFDVFDLSLQELLKVKISVATRSEETLNTVPSAVTVFTRAQIESMPVDYLHELLDFVPGYQTQRAGNRYSYSVRGRRNGSNAKEILLLLDGRSLNTPNNGSANASFEPIPLNLIEKIELIRGPGSALYGSNAFSGVINMISRVDTNEIRFGLGTHQRVDGSVLWSHSTGQWGLNIALSGLSDQGEDYLLDDIFSNIPDQKITSNDARKMQVINASISFNKTQLHYLDQSIDRDGFYITESLQDDFNEASYHYRHLTLSQAIIWSEDIKSQLSLSQLKGGYTSSIQLTKPNAFAATSNPMSKEPLLGIVDVREYTNTMKWHSSWSLQTAVNLQFGIEWRKDEVTRGRIWNNFDLEQISAQDFPVNYYGDFNQSSDVVIGESRTALSVYGQYQHDFQDGYHLTLGLRYDDYSDAGDNVSPRIALVKEIDQQHTIKLLYGEAFRAPAINETQLINNPINLGNPNLDHETVNTWDLIWLASWQRLSLSVDLFSNVYHNPINTVIVSTRTRKFVNGKYADTQGVELESNLQITPNWLVSATFSYFHKLPDSAFREADTLGSLIINYQLGQYKLSLSAIYQDDKEILFHEERITLAEHWLMNGKFIYQFKPNWSFSIQVKNLLDERYYSSSTGNQIEQGIINRGRELSFVTAWQF